MARRKLRRGFRHREPDLKAGVTGFGIDLDISAMFLHNSLDRVQTQAGAFPNCLGCEKRLKDVGLYFGGDSWTVVANLDYYATVLVVSADTEFAFSVHGVNRIIDNVGPDLIKFATKRIHEEGDALVVALHDHSLFQFVIQDRKRGFQALYNVHNLHRRLVHVSVFLDCADQIRYPRSAALDFMQQTRDLHRSGDPAESGSSRLRIEEGKQKFDIIPIDVPPSKAGRKHPQVVLSMTAQQRINLILQVADGQRVRRNYILLCERSFQFFDLRFLGRCKIASSQIQTRVPDFL